MMRRSELLKKTPTKLPPLSKFLTRLTLNFIYAICFCAIALFIGMAGYHYTENMTWLDAFANASMILSGMGPLGQLTTTSGKLFAGFYALFSGLAFIAIMAVIFSPIIHRFFHKLHIDMDDR